MASNTHQEKQASDNVATDAMMILQTELALVILCALSVQCVAPDRLCLSDLATQLGN
jgi:hypothetical protein